MGPPRDLRRICVFCASSFGARADYLDAAHALAETLVDQGIALVYGGAAVGLMSAVADATLTRGGEVIGIVPRFLVDREIAHEGLSELHIVESMAERKAVRAALSDGFVSLPGGLGTLEELFEMVVYSQLHLHDKPSGLLNVAGYYDHLQAFLQHAVAEQLIKPANLDLLLVDDHPGRLLDRMAVFSPTPTDKWIDPPV
jgi:uncharacterized protein (TIGR00730 family)